MICAKYPNFYDMISDPLTHFCMSVCVERIGNFCSGSQPPPPPAPVGDGPLRKMRDAFFANLVDEISRWVVRKYRPQQTAEDTTHNESEKCQFGADKCAKKSRANTLCRAVAITAANCKVEGAKVNLVTVRPPPLSSDIVAGGQRKRPQRRRRRLPRIS